MTTIEQLIGRNIRKARADRSQESVGADLGKWLERAWPRQAVSAAEAGRRDFRAVELLAFALALGEPVSRFFDPEHPSDDVEMPSGEVVPANYLRSLFEAHPLGRLDDIGRYASEIRDLAESIELQAGAQRKVQRRLKRGHEEQAKKRKEKK